MSNNAMCLFGEGAQEQYAIFRKVLLQLTGGDPLMGDLTGQWVIFADGYVHGLCGYPSYATAVDFAKHMNLPPPFVIALVDIDEHDVNPLELLAFCAPDPTVDIPNN